MNSNLLRILLLGEKNLARIFSDVFKRVIYGRILNRMLLHTELLEKIVTSDRAFENILGNSKLLEKFLSKERSFEILLSRPDLLEKVLCDDRAFEWILGDEELLDKILSDKRTFRLTASDMEPNRPELLDDSRFIKCFPPGHFHSPLPSYKEISRKWDFIFGEPQQELTEINLNVEQQVKLLKTFTDQYLGDMPDYGMAEKDGLRFYHGNNFYSCKDAALLHCMIRYLKPERIIEVGSGFSSCMILDTNELFFDGKIQLTLIEPYPDERLYKNIKPIDRKTTRIHETHMEDIPLKTFSELRAHDILFIDSTHVSKIGSDVNYLLFNILPCLNTGVFIHFHDIFYPFEYLKHWILKGRAWNEAYILRAFLQYNPAFKIRLFTSYLLCFHDYLFENEKWKKIPEGGSYGSFWIEKVHD